MTIDAIKALLSQHVEGLSARTIQSLIKIPKKDINSVLYSHRSIFKSEGDSPPIWSLIDPAPIRHRVPDRLKMDFNFGGEFTIQVLQTTWRVKLGSMEMSRNDPPIVVEKTSENGLLICVSNVFVLGETDPDVKGHDEYQIALAASTLLWESIKRSNLELSQINWGEQIRDIILKFATQQSKN